MTQAGFDLRPSAPGCVGCGFPTRIMLIVNPGNHHFPICGDASCTAVAKKRLDDNKGADCSTPLRNPDPLP